MDGGAWWAAVHGVARCWTWLSGFTFTFHFHALEKEMATHSSVLAWRIPGTGEPNGLPMGSHKVGHDWSDLAAAAAVVQMVKNLPAMQETQVRSLGQEDLLEKKMATPSSILAWGNSMDRWAWWASLWLQRVRHDWATNSFTFFFFWSLV